MTTFGLLLILYKPAEGLGRLMLSSVKYSPRLKLVLVMIVLPVIFNGMQFWLTDNIIKSKAQDEGYTKLPSDEEKHSNSDFMTGINTLTPGTNIENQTETKIHVAEK